MKLAVAQRGVLSSRPQQEMKIPPRIAICGISLPWPVWSLMSSCNALFLRLRNASLTSCHSCSSSDHIIALSARAQTKKQSSTAPHSLPAPHRSCQDIQLRSQPSPKVQVRHPAQAVCHTQPPPITNAAQTQREHGPTLPAA